MLNYPLLVFLDTNIYKRCKYDIGEDKVLTLLKNLVNQGKIKLYTSNIVVREVEKHIKQDTLDAISSFNKTRKEILRLISPSIVCETELSPIFKIPNKDGIIKNALSMFKKYIDECKIIYLDNNGIEIDKILDDYFYANPPFENREIKKNEFPDAFIIAKLKKEFSKNKPLWVISQDDGFKKALEDKECFNCLSTIKELLNIINKQDKLYDQIISYINNINILDEISNKLIRKLKYDNIEVDGIDCDRKGLCEGYEYTDSDIINVSIESIVLSSVDEISDTSINLTLLCDAIFEVSCTYDDYDNSIWDSEEKEYMYIDEGRIDEEHKKEFECGLVIIVSQEKSEYSFIIDNITYDIVLDQYSRTKRTYAQVEDPEIL